MTMTSIIEKLVGDLGDKKKYREYKARVKALPEPYRSTGGALERYLMYFGPSNDGKGLVAMLEDLADLLETSERDGVAVRDLVGSDPVEFAEAFLDNYPGGSWIRKERSRLSTAIDRAVGDAGGEKGTDG
jgi:DNA-binding ferritin-like protein (Dps family)